MGNCLCRRQPVSSIDGDDEGLTTRDKQSAASSTEVRIRISKKQLEELLSQAEAKGFSTRDVMKELIHMSRADSDELIHDQNHWRPALKSIAEEPDD